MQKWAPFTRCGSAGKEALSIPFGSRSCADPEIPSNLRQRPRLTFLPGPKPCASLVFSAAETLYGFFTSEVKMHTFPRLATLNSSQPSVLATLNSIPAPL